MKENVIVSVPADHSDTSNTDRENLHVQKIQKVKSASGAVVKSEKGKRKALCPC